MKTFLIFLSVAFVLVASGCKNSRDAAIETKTVVKQYSDGLAKVPSKTTTVTELASLRQAINMYSVENEKYPENLSDLSVRIENIDNYEYDSQTGKVKSKHYPNL